jgi:inorganic pyrophosphatase
MRALVLVAGFIFLAAAQTAAVRDVGARGLDAPDLEVVDAYTLRGERSFLSGYPPMNDDGTVNVVVEIPTGTTEKWEVVKPSGEIRWEFVDGKPRIVAYLGYPGNYGMLPRTLLPRERGGDGDPLDVIVLGPALPRGTVVRARVIGVLKLLDGGEQDDKILAVRDGDPLASAANVRQLDEKFPGVSRIVEIWFESYKGPGVLEVKGFDGPDAGMKLIEAAAAAFAD